VVIDIGTGDGKAALRRARREPATLVIGLDAAAEPLAETSRRAARPARRGGSPNALFLVAGAETLPGPLPARAHEATVVLPWGSLLRGLVLPEPAVLEALAGVLRPGGRLELLLSVTAADVSAGLPVFDGRSVLRLADAYAGAGLECLELREARSDDVERLSSSWARRLGIPERRAAWLMSLEKCA
jgi:16S rRNA (adenine(1408)-N(1))-methyltransferase